MWMVVMMMKIDVGASLSQVFAPSPFNGVVVVMKIYGGWWQGSTVWRCDGDC